MGVTQKRGLKISRGAAERWARVFAALMACGSLGEALDEMADLEAAWSAASRGKRATSREIRLRIQAAVGECLRLRRARKRGTGRLFGRTGEQWARILAAFESDLPAEMHEAFERLGSRTILRRCGNCRRPFFVEDSGHRYCRDLCADRAYRRANSEVVREQTRLRVAKWRADRRQRAERKD